MNFISNLFKGDSVEKFKSIVQEINNFESEVQKLKNEDFKTETEKLKERLKAGETFEEITPYAFALVREAAKRTLGQRPYDVQLIGGLVLHSGAVAEMMTGEGKTLSAVAPAYLNALTDQGVHLVTVNEYLARRDAVWMGQIYRLLGMSVACLVPNGAYLYDPDFKVPEDGQALIDKERDTTGSFLVQQEFLKPCSRREGYLAHITYGTNHEFGFDYLRDNLAYSIENQSQRTPHFAIIDEVDSILIDEARTPLIIAAPDEQSSNFYKTFARAVTHLKLDEDYTIEEKRRAVSITDSGISKIEKMLGVKNLYAPQNIRLVHYLEESLRAHAVYKKDKDYVVKNGEIFIVDEFTGRLLQGRRYQGGLHQAIEAKENVHVKEESRTYAKISIQNYFRLYKKISGMTGTAQTSAEEFHKVYNLEVVSIPPHRPLARIDYPDIVYKTEDAKWNAIVAEIKDYHKRGQPVLVGTTSIAKNEILAGLLSQANIPHEVLNAKNNEREGSIIAQAGRLEGVTVATNMAGRGVDIILGGNPPNPEEAKRIRELGGLHVIGTERHEARRIDNQLRGRAARQGDPGSSRFFLSLEDDLVRIFGGDRVKSMMERFNLPDDMPIEVGMVSKAVAQAQAKVEGANFDMRKHLLEYDDILNKQRSNVYKKRQEILGDLKKEDFSNFIYDTVNDFLVKIYNSPEEEVQSDNPEDKALTKAEKIRKVFEESGVVNKDHQYPESGELEDLQGLLVKRSLEASLDPTSKNKLLSILDMLWMTHLENLEALNESIGLRAYGQRDPLVEFKQESRNLFQGFWDTFNSFVFGNIFRTVDHSGHNHDHPHEHPQVSNSNVAGPEKIGRNDPCPCGSGKKYKKCGLINAPEHKK